MIVTMNRVNGVFENELSVTMTFVANNKDVIFINSDNFTNDDASLLIDESQVEIDALIGDASYDIGHTFSQRLLEILMILILWLTKWGINLVHHTPLMEALEVVDQTEQPLIKSLREIPHP